jgi:hypothetical protein
MDVSRIRQFPLATLPLRIPAVMLKEYEVREFHRSLKLFRFTNLSLLELERSAPRNSSATAEQIKGRDK